MKLTIYITSFDFVTDFASQNTTRENSNILSHSMNTYEGWGLSFSIQTSAELIIASFLCPLQ